MSNTAPKNVNQDRASLAPVAGGEASPGELLCSDTQYMDERSARTAHRWIDSWRNMPRQEFEESVRCL